MREQAYLNQTINRANINEKHGEMFQIIKNQTNSKYKNNIEFFSYYPNEK